MSDHRRTRRTFAAIAACAGAIGCSAILGLRDDYELGGAEAGSDAGSDRSMQDAPIGDASDAAAKPDVIDAGGGCDANFASDPLNCGRCGHDCLGGDCADAACQPFTIAVQPSGGGTATYMIAVDDTGVYWTDNGGGHILSVAADAGPSDAGGHVVYSSGSNNVVPTYLVLDANTAYFVLSQAPGAGVWRIGKDSSNLRVLSPATDSYAPTAIGLTGGALYWSDRGTFTADSGAVNTVLVDGGGFATLVEGGAPYGLAVDATQVYWGNLFPSAIMASALDGGDAHTLSSQEANPFALAVDATHVYWINASGQTSIRRIALDGGAFAEDYATQLHAPFSIAIDSTYVYWTNSGTDVPDGGAASIMKCARSSVCTTPTVVAAVPENPLYIAVDATAIYWTTGISNSVRKVAK